jgi:hypothetical protein
MVSTDSPASPGDRHHRPGHPLDEALVLLSLGEPIDPELTEHAQTCQWCQAELDGYRHLVGLARERPTALPVDGVLDHPLLRPPPRVWAAIAAELGVASGPVVASPVAASPVVDSPVVDSGPVVIPASDGPAPVAPADISGRPRGSGRHGAAASPPARWRRPRVLLAAAAAVVAVALGGVGGYALGHGNSATARPTALQAELAPQPGGPAEVTGQAVIAPSTRGYTLQVTTDRLPERTGYYEVWLFNPTINQMIAVGSLGVGHAGQFTVPAGVDLSEYHIVDVSAQNFDGNNQHERSVLRGTLSQ